MIYTTASWWYAKPVGLDKKRTKISLRSFWDRHSRWNRSEILIFSYLYCIISSLEYIFLKELLFKNLWERIFVCHSCPKKNWVKTWFFISTLYCYFFLSFMLLIKITRCTTTAANIKIVPQTLIIKGTSVNNSKTFISVPKNQQNEAINHKTLTFFIIITDLQVYYSIKLAEGQEISDILRFAQSDIFTSWKWYWNLRFQWYYIRL